MRHLGIIDPVSEIAIDGSSGVPEPGLMASLFRTLTVVKVSARFEVGRDKARRASRNVSS